MWATSVQSHKPKAKELSVFVVYNYVAAELQFQGIMNLFKPSTVKRQRMEWEEIFANHMHGLQLYII